MADDQTHVDPITGKPTTDPLPAAQDLPGAARGSREGWKSMINGGSPRVPDQRNQADTPARPVDPGADLSEGSVPEASSKRE